MKYKFDLNEDDFDIIIAEKRLKELKKGKEELIPADIVWKNLDIK